MATALAVTSKNVTVPVAVDGVTKAVIPTLPTPESSAELKLMVIVEAWAFTVSVRTTDVLPV